MQADALFWPPWVHFRDDGPVYFPAASPCSPEHRHVVRVTGTPVKDRAPRQSDEESGQGPAGEQTGHPTPLRC